MQPSFGMLMPNRSYTAGSKFRYGFNGKENDNDVKGTGNQQDYGMRIYDPRIGKFLSVDPLKSGYPHLTPYQFAGNTPIQAIDLDGMEPQGFMVYWKETSSEYMTKWNFTVQDVYDYETKKVWTVMHYPNTNQYFYWETKYENAQRLFSPENTNLNKINGEWSGFFKEFKPKQFSEDKSLYYGMVGMLATPFVALGAVEAGAAAYFSVQSVLVSVESYLTRAITKGLLEYWTHVVTASSIAKNIAAILDESSGLPSEKVRVKLLESIFHEANGLLCAIFKTSNGKDLEFAAEKVVNGNILELNDMTLYPIGAKGNEWKGDFDGVFIPIIEKLNEYAKANGFEKLKVTMKRAAKSSSANPGHEFERIFDLTK